MKLKRLFGILLMLVLPLLMACGTAQKRWMDTRIVKDTIRIKETVTLRDTVFITPKASVQEVVRISDLKPKKTLIKQEKNARVTIRKVHDTLYIRADCDTLQLVAQIKDKLKATTAVKEVTKTQFIDRPYTPLYMKALAWVGGLCILWVLFIIAKSKINIFSK